MPMVFGVCVCVSLLLGLVFYLALNGAQAYPLERTLEYCSFEEAAAVAAPSYCDVGESCYNSTQQLDQVGHEEQVCLCLLPPFPASPSKRVSGGVRHLPVTAAGSLPRSALWCMCACVES
jgi:hypothetical protein